ncbi:NAD(P)-dependent oxidoreductase [Longirhabdus pacifica]|uniref:NAD(P)-dependent oxidoreductase n=1 Tax=Longirhabdus pacifica TaxID=2305227 RepID=UPI001008BCC3|nr:NAD(P)-dependent oxidoreductase [Longirhabdus pacifica]
MSKGLSTVGFIGTGVMGKSMAHHILKEGYELYVHTRTKSKAQSLINEGAHWCEDISSLVQSSQLIITMIGTPQDVEDVYLSEKGMIHEANEGTYFIDMTTSSPSLAKKLFSAAADKHCYVFDAPVSGGDVGAREGKLSIMVGGDKEKFHDVLPVLQTMGTQIMYQGDAGAGQYTKMSNQIAVAGTMLGVCEAMIFAEKSGLHQDTVLQSISRGAAGSWTMSNLAPRIINNDFAPGFYIRHFIKDMKIAIEAAEELDMKLPGLMLAKQLYEQLVDKGEEDSGTQALYKWYQHHMK